MVDRLRLYALQGVGWQPATTGWGAAAGGEFAGADHFHFYALRWSGRTVEFDDSNRMRPSILQLMNLEPLASDFALQDDLGYPAE